MAVASMQKFFENNIYVKENAQNQWKKKSRM